MNSEPTANRSSIPPPGALTGATTHPGIISTGFGVRGIAFLLDYALVYAITLLMLTQWLLPSMHPSFTPEFRELIEAQQHITEDRARSESQFQLLLHFSLKHAQALETINTAFLFTFWLYFGFSEFLLSGTTLGKKVFKLRVIDADSLNTASPRALFVRNCIKTIAACMLFPLLVTSFFLAIFTKRKQAGHDLLARTLVVREFNGMIPLASNRTDR